MLSNKWSYNFGQDCMYLIENENFLSKKIQNLSLENRKIKYGSVKILFISDSNKNKYINLNTLYSSSKLKCFIMIFRFYK